MRAHADEHAGPDFDIVVEGATDPERAAETVRPFAEAGATWWLESMWEEPNGPEELRERIRSGPPRLQ